MSWRSIGLGYIGESYMCIVTDVGGWRLVGEVCYWVFRLQLHMELLFRGFS
jgi:hypothetical protein